MNYFTCKSDYMQGRDLLAFGDKSKNNKNLAYFSAIFYEYLKSKTVFKGFLVEARFPGNFGI
jgi:hypothetical protein